MNTETPEVNFDAPVKKTKKKGRAAKTAAAAKPTAVFPGLTRTACAAACNAKSCAISHKPYCAHPTKGGLQSIDQSDPAALKRVQAARDQIDVRLDPDRFK